MSDTTNTATRCVARGPREIRCVLLAGHRGEHACGPFTWGSSDDSAVATPEGASRQFFWGNRAVPWEERRALAARREEPRQEETETKQAKKAKGKPRRPRTRKEKSPPTPDK